jgi:exopolyphosphatase / guanosine-5'-triphosphate,3'-diphosphate pyrophosphatase
LTAGEIDHWLSVLSEKTNEQRIFDFKLKPDRADVIVPACHIYQKIMAYGFSKQMMVPKIGLGDGIILDIFQKWKSQQSLKHKVK